MITSSSIWASMWIFDVENHLCLDVGRASARQQLPQQSNVELKSDLRI